MTELHLYCEVCDRKIKKNDEVYTILYSPNASILGKELYFCVKCFKQMAGKELSEKIKNGWIRE